ncbi:cocaine- and amphetamine-regulated transcript protein-like [Gadus macrocephalus]|uniref:cocaine- and amphetamine-regulated transcript protein-like n=1 Tax=Gadus macrocephalus TaxID=80720 RepID=UPI0028CB731A|nr:cocaine- and amphetamine-regulated transcript protein-like [Gadus macrocephalus]
MTLDGGDSVASRGGLEQEMNVGQLRSRGGRWPLGLLCVLLAAGRHGHADTEELSTRYSAHFPATLDLDERQLMTDLHGVLERLKNDNRFPTQGMKHNYVPMCAPGELCATRKGSRIGKLCDCFLPRTCNTLLHRCL